MRSQKQVVESLLLSASSISLSEAEPGADENVGELVPDPQVCREFHVTSMTLWRWDHDAQLKFPPPIKIRGRKFRHRGALEAFKRQLVRTAIARREVAA